jgi:hypothetical protein
VGVSFHVPVRFDVFTLFEGQHGEVGRDQSADAESGR